MRAMYLLSLAAIPFLPLPAPRWALTSKMMPVDRIFALAFSAACGVGAAGLAALHWIDRHWPEDPELPRPHDLLPEEYR